MKNLFLALAFTLVSSASFAENNVTLKSTSTDFGPCTVTTTTTIVDGYGESNTVSVTNTANDCFSAWSANQDQIKKMKKGLEGAQ